MLRKAICIFVMVLILNGMFVPFFRVQEVSAEWTGTVYIRADGRIEPLDAPISTVDNVTYTLTCKIQSNDNGIVIERGDIIINGSNFVLEGSESYLSKGIFLLNVKNVTLLNFNIRKFYDGIYLSNSSENFICKNKISNNSYGVIVTDSSDNNILVDNEICDNNEDGLWLIFSSRNRVFNNTIYNNKYYGFGLFASYNTLRGNKIFNNTYNFGVWCDTEISDYTNDVDTSNTVNGKSIYYLVSKENLMVPPDAGYVALINCSNITIQNMQLTNNMDGIVLIFTSNSTVSGNFVANNENGIGLWFSFNNMIVGNTIANNSFSGVWLFKSRNNAIRENVIMENSEGVWLYGATDNQLYHNEFIDNSKQIDSSNSINVWDNYYPSGGNYWSDYKGVDEKSGPNQDQLGSDGIGDTPYVIDANNIDHYPLMQPYSAKSLGPPGTYVWIYWKRDNNYNFDIDLNVTDAPGVVGSGQVIFWAHQFSFVNGSGGYIGLQIVGSQKKAIFSIWDAISGEPGNPFQEDDGHGWQIIINYDWKLNHKYRLRIWELNVEQNGDEWWLAAVYDYASGVDTIIGKILVPAAWGWLTNTSVTWVEYAGFDNYESRNIPYTRAVFSNLFARNPMGDSKPDKLKVSYGTKPADNSDVDYYGGSEYALEAGNDVVRDTHEGWLTDLFISLNMQMVSDSNYAYIGTIYDSPFAGRSFYSYLAIPANAPVTISYRGYLFYGGQFASKQNIISGKEVKLFIDSQLFSTFVTGENLPNIDGVVNVSLSEGLHSCEVRFDGNGDLNSAIRKFTLIAYKSSEFYMGRDSFSFDNWEYTFNEHLMLFDKLLEEGIVDQFMKIPFVAIFPILSAPGHCFGMAATSSIYFLNPNLKPKAVDTYQLSKEDAVWDIDHYQFLVYIQTLQCRDLSYVLNEIKKCIDSGMPVMLSYSTPKFAHTITVIGYHQESDEIFLICYDNNYAGGSVVYSITDGKLLFRYDDTPINITSVALTDPRSLPVPISSIDITSALKEIFSAYLGITIHSPVDVKITDKSGNALIIQNNTIVRNDFLNSYLYLSQDIKIILLPSNGSYMIEGVGRDYGEASIDYICMADDNILTYQYNNLTINYGDKIYLNTTQAETAYIDLGGDGTMDNEIQASIIPEFPSALILPLLMLATLVTTVLLRKKRKTKPSFPKIFHALFLLLGVCLCRVPLRFIRKLYFLN